MIARLAVIGAGLIVLGLAHVGGNGTATVLIGAGLLAVAGLVLLAKNKGVLPAGRKGGRR
ncbi:MAG TPA: hypothetical protein VH969_07730 [Actinophytocola sp.]|uniref:hypothetical protein n=1 Tax=Actinophytocola sp. TaxID=1872138 RepID=UPI002F9576FD